MLVKLILPPFVFLDLFPQFQILNLYKCGQSNNVNIKLACFKGDDDSIKLQSLKPYQPTSCFSGDGFGVVYNTAEELTNELENLGVTNANQLVSQAQLVN